MRANYARWQDKWPQEKQATGACACGEGAEGQETESDYRKPGPIKSGKGAGAAAGKRDAYIAMPADREPSEGARTSSAGATRILRMRAEYRVLSALQAPFEFVFWVIAQRKGKLADRLANEGIAPFAEPALGGKGFDLAPKEKAPR